MTPQENLLNYIIIKIESSKLFYINRIDDILFEIFTKDFLALLKESILDRFNNGWSLFDPDPTINPKFWYNPHKKVCGKFGLIFNSYENIIFTADVISQMKVNSNIKNIIREVINIFVGDFVNAQKLSNIQQLTFKKMGALAYYYYKTLTLFPKIPHQENDLFLLNVFSATEDQNNFNYLKFLFEERIKCYFNNRNLLQDDNQQNLNVLYNDNIYLPNLLGLSFFDLDFGYNVQNYDSRMEKIVKSLKEKYSGNFMIQFNNFSTKFANFYSGWNDLGVPGRYAIVFPYFSFGKGLYDKINTRKINNENI